MKIESIYHIEAFSMFSDDRLPTVRAVVSFIQTVVKKVWQATTLSNKTAYSKSPNMRSIPSLLVYNSLNVLFATLTSYINRAVIQFRIVSMILWNIYGGRITGPCIWWLTPKTGGGGGMKFWYWLVLGYWLRLGWGKYGCWVGWGFCI